MRVVLVLGFIFLVVAVVESDVVRADDDSEEVTFVDEIYFEDESGNLVEINDETDDETSDETELLLPSNVFFHLFTRNNPSSSQQIYIGDTSGLSSSNWNASKPTRFITHGWLNSYISDSCRLIRDAYLEEGDYNLILIDWSKIAMRTYGFGVRRVKLVGEYVAKMIDYLETRGMDLSSIVIVGHSLGAHIAGLAALQATNTVGYVVGLDPALPYFWFSSSGSRIAKGDAANVQIIHTNAGKLGYKDAIGDIDFYPNGGSCQNGCILDVTGTCSHLRAFKFFAESITSEKGFYGLLCDSWLNFRGDKCTGNTTTYMGGSIPTTISESGSYYLRTASSSPYALGPI